MTDGPNETGSFRRQIPPEGHVTLRFEKFSSFVEEYRAGISLGGVFIKTHRPRPIGTEVHFEFKLTDGFRLLHGQGVVVWQRPNDLGPDSPAGMGVRFTAIDESGRQLVLKLLEEQVKAGGPPFEVDRVAEGGISADSEMSVNPDPLGEEEPTLVGTSVQEVNPSLPNPAELPVQKQAQLGFDAPWGKKLPGVPRDLLAEESDPEVEKAVNTIRPTIPAAASEQTAPEPAASEPAAPSVPPVSSNQVLTPVAPPIEEKVPSSTPKPHLASSPDTQFKLEDISAEEPTLIGSNQAHQGVLPLSTPPADPAPELFLAAEAPSMDPPAQGAASGTPDKREISLEDSMMEAADEVEATVELEDPVIDFDPPPEEISFDPGPATLAPDSQLSLVGSSAETDEPGFEAPAFEAPVGPGGLAGSESPAGPTDIEPTADIGPTADIEPTAEISFGKGASMGEPPTSFDQPSFDVEPTAEMPTFEPTAEMPAFEPPAAPSFDDASAGSSEFDAAAVPESTDVLPTASLSSFSSDSTPATTSEQSPREEVATAAPSFEAASFDSPSFDSSSFDSPSFEKVSELGVPQGVAEPQGASAAPSEPLSSATDDGSSGSSLFSTHPADSTSDPAGGAPPPISHTADFVDPWPDSDQEDDSWMTEGEDFAPPPRKGAGRYLIALGLVAALVAGVYFFRATLSSLVGLSSGSDSQVVAQAGNRKAPKHQPAPAVDPSGAEAESTGEEDLLQEEMIEVGAEPEIDSGSETGLDPGGSITETAPEVVAPAFDEPARQTSSPAIEPATATVPPPTPPPNRDRAAQAQAIGGARAVTGIDWSRSSQGTRITIQFSDSFSNDDFRHDPLAWAADREMVSLLGVENFPKSEIAVGTDELKRIRLGFHPGQELRLVFDLSKSGSSIRDLKALGSRLEILIQ